MRFIWLCALSAGLTACASSQTGAPAHTPATAPTAASVPAVNAATLEAYHWQLREVRDAQGQQQPDWVLPPAPAAAETQPPSGARAVQLSFAQNQVAVARLCNALSAGYRVEGQALRIGAVRGTRMACPDSAAMALEERVGQRLSQAHQWRIETPGAAPVLTLVFADGGQWLLDGTPTDATRYGSAGERMFLEVAPERVACSHPLIPNYQCLRVRAIEYDDQGLKTRTGEWQNWYGDIQGYTHLPGVRNVLRIKRYRQADVPADAPAFVHVLDMTVESEIVR